MTTKLHTLLVRLFFFLIFVSATSAAYLLLPDEPTPHPRPPLFEKGGEKRATATPIVILRPQSEESLKSNTTTDANLKGSLDFARDDNERDSSSARASLGMTVKTDNFQTATLAINDKKYSLQFKADENLLTAMRRLDDTDSNFQFSGREYPSLGFFVEEINDIKNNPANNQYWVYYINDQSATVGISLYILKLNDLIKWQYDKAKF